MKIAIPSKNRPDVLTTDFIKNDGNVYLFVDENEVDRYREKNAGVKIIGVKPNNQGIGYARNYILDYFKTGEKVVMLDDDIQGFYRISGEKLEKMGIEETMRVFEKSFDILERGDSKLWGFYPISNSFYMSWKKPINFTGFVIGTCCGVIVSDLRYDIEATLKEDYDFTLNHIKKFGKVLRWNCYSVKAKHYTNKGGACDYRTKERERAVCDYLKNKYPGMVADNPRRENEVLIRIKTAKNGQNNA